MTPTIDDLLNEIDVLEKKQKELRGTVKSLLELIRCLRVFIDNMATKGEKIEKLL